MLVHSYWIGAVEDIGVKGQLIFQNKVVCNGKAVWSHYHDDIFVTVYGDNSCIVGPVIPVSDAKRIASDLDWVSCSCDDDGEYVTGEFDSGSFVIGMGEANFSLSKGDLKIQMDCDDLDGLICWLGDVSEGKDYRVYEEGE